MSFFNEYINKTDFSPIIDFIHQEGELVRYAKNDYFIRINDNRWLVGLIKSGIFRYTMSDESGSEFTVNFAFTNDIITSIVSCIRQSPSQVNVQAAMDSEIHIIQYEKFAEFFDRNMNNQRLGRLLFEELYIRKTERLVSFYAETAEQRYIKLMKQYPDLKEVVFLKEIASYLSVTPETVSHIRRKLRDK